MAKENRGLGRGFASLFGVNEVDLELKPQSGDKPVELPLADIDPNREQPRKNFDEEKLRELADSIKEHGVIQPIIVAPVGARYMIIVGERRFRASHIAGKKSIPAIVRAYTPQQIREISLVENLQRDDLNPIEAARAIKQLMDEFNMTQETAAERLGKSRSSIANNLRLLTLDPEVIKLIEDGRLSAGHARALVVIPQHAEQLKLALKACDNKMNVREIEKAVRGQLNPQPTPLKTNQPSIELKELVDNMQRAFATKISAIGNSQKGRIYIDYFTRDDLDRICLLVESWMKTSYNDN